MRENWELLRSRPLCCFGQGQIPAFHKSSVHSEKKWSFDAARSEKLSPKADFKVPPRSQHFIAVLDLRRRTRKEELGTESGGFPIVAAAEVLAGDLEELPRHLAG